MRPIRGNACWMHVNIRLILKPPDASAPKERQRSVGGMLGGTHCYNDTAFRGWMGSRLI